MPEGSSKLKAISDLPRRARSPRRDGDDVDGDDEDGGDEDGGDVDPAKTDD